MVGRGVGRNGVGGSRPSSPGRWARLGLRIFALAAVMFGLFGAAQASAATSDQAVTFQGDPSHNADVTAFSLGGDLTQSWNQTLGIDVSYPLIANGIIYVTTADPNTVWAIDAGSGTVLWSKAVGGNTVGSGIAYDAGQVFAVNVDGLLTALDATTGDTDWSVQLPGQYDFGAAPTVLDGLVFVDGSGVGGNVYAVRQADGSLAWTDQDGGEDSSPAVTGSGLYVSYACQLAYDIDPFSGATLWSHTTSCEGGGGATPVVADGEVFVRDIVTGDAILSASDGSDVGTLNASVPPAVGDGMAFEVDEGVLTAVSEDGLGNTSWSTPTADDIDTAPVVVGDLVFAGGDSTIYAFDASTGAVEWSGTVANPISGTSDLNANPGSGLAAGEGLLAIPDEDDLAVFTEPSSSSLAPVNSTAPSVLDSARAGQPVGADAGLWSGNPTGYSYQWELCGSSGTVCADISGATGEAYTPAASDVGSTLKVQVTARNGDGFGIATSPASATIVAAAAQNSAPPTITGSPFAGGTLTVKTGAWTPTPPSFDYQWLLCTNQYSCLAISGATGSSYTTTSAEQGDAIEVVVDPVDTGGETPGVISAPTSQLIAPAPPSNAKPPMITGSTTYPGGTLSADSGAWTDYPTSFTYQWYRCNASTGACAPIPGATSQDYALTASDLGEDLKFGAVATNAYGTSSESQSGLVGPISSSVPGNTLPPTFAGPLVSGQTLTGNPGVWTGSPTSYAYQWMRCYGESCAAISGATAANYTATTADVGRYLELQVIAINAAGSSRPAVTSIEGPVSGPASTQSAPVTVKPVLDYTETVPTALLATVVKQGLKVSLACTRLCDVTLRLSAPIGARHRTEVAATLKAVLSAGVHRTLTVKLTAAAVSAIKKARLRSLAATLATTLTSTGAATKSSVRKLTLRS